MQTAVGRKPSACYSTQYLSTTGDRDTRCDIVVERLARGLEGVRSAMEVHHSSALLPSILAALKLGVVMGSAVVGA